MARYVGAILVVVSISLITYGISLIMNGVQVNYSTIEIPTYTFETVGPGNVTVTKAETLYHETVRERGLGPSESLEFAFDVDEGNFTIYCGYGIYMDVAHFPPLAVDLYRMVDGSWERVDLLDLNFEGHAKNVDGEYEFFHEGKFAAKVAEPGRFKLTVGTNRTAFIRVLDMEVQRVYRETVHYPYPMLQVNYGQKSYVLISDVSLQNLQKGTALALLGMAILLVYSSLLLAFRRR